MITSTTVDLERQNEITEFLQDLPDIIEVQFASDPVSSEKFGTSCTITTDSVTMSVLAGCMISCTYGTGPPAPCNATMRCQNF